VNLCLSRLFDNLIVRGVLGLCNAAALVWFARSVERIFGRSAGIWYALLQASQFHVMYYASRTLPNMFALIFSKVVCHVININ
jgi:alpha-1,6-mannosyltransferase